MMTKSGRAAGDHSAVAEQYVKLVLATGKHDKNYVDAFYGPEEWRQDTDQPLEAIDKQAAALIADVERLGPPAGDELAGLRHRYLRIQLRSMRARITYLQGTRLKFDEESKALYDAVAPKKPDEYFSESIAKLEKLLPGTGPILDRYEAHRKQFFVPTTKLHGVFEAAIEEARTRTKRHISLPEGESFIVEYVKGKVWSAYNWYKGKSHSLIQVNTDLPSPIQNAVHLACHEGYPGHHVYNALLEDNLVRKRGWLEYTVYPLYSPQSLIAEGTAEYGVEVAFPDAEQLAFKRDALFPLAGLDRGKAGTQHAVQHIVNDLSYARTESARRYLDGELTREQAVKWLTRFGLMSEAAAKQRMAFVDEHRAYVINYNLGQDLIRNFMEKSGATAKNPKKQWDEFARLLSSPRLPSDL